jgi:lipid A 3-O-deacylase PagL
MEFARPICPFFTLSAHSQRWLRLAVVFSVVVMMGLCCDVQGQSSPEIQNHSLDVSAWAAGATGEEGFNAFTESQIFTTGIFVGIPLTSEIGDRWYRGRLQYGADFIPVFVQFTPRISGIGFDPVILRWISSARRGRVVSFIELGGGGLHTNKNFPRGDTSNFNFMARGGGGVQIATRRSQALEIACRWWHISNANLGNRNPEFNGIQVSVGWHWFK